MDKHHRLSISFKNQYQHVYEHLQDIPNKSDYIAKAVEAYMSGGKHQTVSHEEIRGIVLGILQEQGDIPMIIEMLSSSQMEQLSQEDAKLISELF